MSFLEFIKYIRISPNDKNVELTPEQHAFLNWIERCKKKGTKPIQVKRKWKIIGLFDTYKFRIINDL